MSAKTGVAPVSATELAVAAKVNDGTMTSSPGPTPGGQQAEVQAGRARVDGDAGTAGDRALRRTPARTPRPRGPGRACRTAQHAVDGRALLVADDRLGGRDRAAPSVLLHVFTGRPQPSVGFDVRLARLRARPRRRSPTSSSGTPARPTQPIRRAGTPATSAKSGTSLVTTAPAATVAQRPIVTGATQTARAPIEAPSLHGHADRLPVVRRSSSEPSGLTARG